jgi:hypothetical protein
MYAPKAPEPQARAAASQTKKPGSGRDAIGHQARPQRASPTSGIGPAGDRQAVAAETTIAEAPPPYTSWNFGAIPLYPPATPRNSLIERELAVASADDRLEHEANRLASQAMQMLEPTLSVTPTPPRLRRADGLAESGIAAPPIVHEVIQSTGQSLDGRVRTFFEHRFGHDFNRVRVHTDAKAAESASSIGAAAYTVGSQIVFANGRYRPDAPKEFALLAHELAHVTLSTRFRGPLMVARQTVEQYETYGVALERKQFEEAAHFTYWERKLQDAGFVVAVDPAAGPRLAFAEENDAVLSVVWQMRPAPDISAPVTHLLTVPQRPAKGSRDLVYQIVFRPRSSPDKKATAEIHFVAEELGGAVTPEAPSTTFVPKIQGGYNHAGFPNNDPLAYWDAHQDEQRQVFHWIENEAGAKFDQIITAKTRGGTTSFRIKGEKDPSGKVNVSDLVIMFLERHAAPADYASHDFADAAIEDAQTVPDSIHQDKLGRINGLDSVPAEERAVVKFAIFQYFRSNTADPRRPRPGTRNAEVDVILPIPNPPAGMATRANTNRRALYTLRFRPRSNDVDVVRTGEEGRDVTLTRQGSLAQVNGFAAHATGATEQDKVASLTGWLKHRYPGITPAASSSVADLEKDVTTKIRDGSGDRAWFEKNYGIIVLDAGAAATWLATKVGFKEKKELQDLKDFTPEELRLLELALERMSDPIVAAFRNVRMVRQRALFKFIPGTKPPDFEEKPDVGGDTTQGTTRTIRIFDAAMRNIDTLFLGGIDAQGQRSAVAAPTQPIAHEFGHVIARMPGVQKAFDALVRAKGIRPITWYAATDPPGELFPEAFSLFYLDPAWLKANWPDLFNFFAELDRTGLPPKVTP